MRHTRGRQARWGIIALACGLVAPLCGAADEHAMSPSDRAVQQLKADVLAFSQAAQRIENDVLLPTQARVSIYLSNELGGFLLSEFSVTVDDGRPTVHHYDDTDARALLADGSAQRLTRLLLPKGVHRIRASFRGRYADAGADSPPLTGTLDTRFEKQSGENELELRLDRQRRVGSQPRLQLRYGRVTTTPETAGTAQDLRLRHAIFLRHDDRPFSALLELGQIAAPGDSATTSASYHRQLAASHLAFGMHERAETLHRSAAIRDAETGRSARAALDLAALEYQRGQWSAARSTLHAVQDHLPAEMEPAWRDLLARVLLAEGRHGEAADVLSPASDASDAMRYNLAVALIQDGRTAEGITLLDRLGRMPATDARQLALRDRANLSLGWHFLASQQGGTAKPVLSRIQLQGPHANRALLGLGWAELAPQGERVARAQIADDTNRRNPFAAFSTLGVLLRPGFLENSLQPRAGLRNFPLHETVGETQDALRRALVPWLELSTRDPADPAVLESRLAIAYALDQLGAQAQASQQYEQAIAMLETQRQQMDAAALAIRQRRMVETIAGGTLDAEASSNWKLLDLPDAAETWLLQDLLAAHRFQEAMKNYRDLRMLARHLDAWSQRLHGIEQAATHNLIDPLMADVPDSVASLRGRLASLRPRLDAAMSGQAQDLEAMALTALQARGQQVEHYLVEARFALARLYDRQGTGDDHAR